ncbi:MAG: DUF664 domain-containing protein, partial [Planctomycetota bacterium]|nr:DUF664 domain-containing protein [Planctomycetota bacterium]
GQGHTFDEVAAFKVESAEVLLAYQDAVYERSKEYLAGLKPVDLVRELDEPQYDPLPTVGVRLVSIVSDNTQHAGQVAYLRGYFEEKRFSLEEVSIFRPGEPVKAKLKYRNIKEANLQVYRVDLMKLYLREKNLSNITKVKLAGIKPELEHNIALGDGKDYIDKEQEAELNLKEEAAYLLIARGDSLFASGLVLITPLKIEVQEGSASGRVRANVINAIEGGYKANVHVKAIGTKDTQFRSGETDLRGIFVADNLRGKATVIAREGETRYAFYRGKKWLGAPETAQQRRGARQQGQQSSSPSYDLNLQLQNKSIQKFNYQQFDQMRRGKQKGVQIKSAF